MYREKMTCGQKCADKITRIVGSWAFIIAQSIVWLGWVALNLAAWAGHWDPYPFILLNLVLGLQAAYTAPVILMSQNRSAEKERLKAQTDLSVDRKAEREMQEVIKRIDLLERGKIDKIIEMLNNRKL